MDDNVELIYDVKRRILAKYPRFGSEIATSYIEFKDNLPFHTAATDGKNIYVDPEYFKSLSEDERLFIIAHEVMHIKFMHMYRLTNKEGKKRDLEVWNIATDAIINANLERDGFTIKEGYVNMPEALNYSAEEFYQILLQEKEKKQKEKENQKQDEQQNEEEGEQQEKQPSQQWSDHSFWEEAFKNQQQQNQEKESSNEKRQSDFEGQMGAGFDEIGEFKENRQEKRERFKARREKTKEAIRGVQEGTIKLGSIGESKSEINWKDLIRREVEKSETIYSRRRSIAENNYAYRLEENDIEDEAETEIMIDVSGSVDLELVKAFLRQIKPLLKQSKLKVGCFNEKFWGLVDIKSVRDIDNFTIPKAARGDSAWTEDWDLAVRSFTKRKEINKIVFTDGDPCPGKMPKDDLKRENVIWLVYGNRHFKPCCGKVIHITEKQLEQLHLVTENCLEEAISR